MCDRCIVFMAHVNSVCTHTSEVLGPRTDWRKLFLRTGTKSSFQGWPQLNSKQGVKIWKDNLVVAKFPAFFLTGPENICTKHSSLQAGYPEVSVSGPEETDGTIQIKQDVRRV